MKKYASQIINTSLKLINQQKKLKLIIKKWVLIREGKPNLPVAFLIRYLLNIKIFYDRVFEKIIRSDYEKVKYLFGKVRRKYIREIAYLNFYLEKFNQYHEHYNIPGTKDISGLNFYSDPNIYPPFQEDLTKIRDLLVSLVNQKANVTFYKFGDGDYFFLKRVEHGSAKPGARALSKTYDEINIDEFMEGVLKNDYIIGDVFPGRRTMFNELFPDRERDFSSDFTHGLVANKWFFKTFKGRIGLIGGREKLELIEKLMLYKKYRDYLGLDKFNDYIYIPQKFAADDVNSLEKSIAEQLKNSSSDIFLLGIGHVKSALLHRLKKYKRAVYVDVGGAIDAIAGIINIRRLHMAKWVNYQLKNYDYSNIDFMNYQGWGRHVYL